MAGVPDPPFLSVEGPEFANRVREADQLTRRVEDANWDFEFAPQVFGVASNCDVAAKEIINVYDGRVQTRLGRLVMKGSGTRFNLLSHESPLSVYIGARQEAFDELNRQVGSQGLHDFAEFRELGPPQEVELYNPTLFYQMRDVVLLERAEWLWPVPNRVRGRAEAAHLRKRYPQPSLHAQRCGEGRW